MKIKGYEIELGKKWHKVTFNEHYGTRSVRFYRDYYVPRLMYTGTLAILPNATQAEYRTKIADDIKICIAKRKHEYID